MNETERYPNKNAKKQTNISDSVIQCCLRAKKHEEAGDFEAAAEVLSPFWKGVGTRPNLKTKGLTNEDKAELLLRAGVITGWKGYSDSIPKSQELAKDLISESQTIFESLGLEEKIAETQIELAGCYWRQGAFEEASSILSVIIDKISDDKEIGNDLKGLAYLRRAATERELKNYKLGLQLLKDGEKFFTASGSDSLKGKYHNELARILWDLAEIEKSREYLDQTLIELTAAGYHFEQAGHKRYRAAVENNIGMLLFSKKQYAEAHEHFDYAKRLFVRLKDRVLAAQVDECRATVFLEQGLDEQAEQVSRRSCATFERAESYGLLADSLTTHGKALARLGHYKLSQQEFERAETVASQMTTIEKAGLALLTLLEELHAFITPDEAREYYQRADSYLKNSEQVDTLNRLRQIARRLLGNNGFTPKQTVAVVEKAKTETAVQPVSDGERNLENLIREIQDQHQKNVQFSPETIEAVKNYFLSDNWEHVKQMLEKTVAVAQTDDPIKPEYVEIVSLRKDFNLNFAEPWKELSLREITHRIENRLIELALLESNGKITGAANLLGFKHYEMLHSIIKSRHPELLAQRTPAIKRKRSIIRKK